MKFIKRKIDKDKIVIYNTSDWHVGSRCFHDKSARELVQRVLDEDAFLTFGGDAIEGKEISSPHFNPAGLDKARVNIEAQGEYFAEIMKPIADRILLLQTGNHELYLSKDFNVVKWMCALIGCPDACGNYQSLLEVNNVTMHFWHGRPTMPRGAKDPIQRQANQMAWLKNKMHSLAGTAQAQYMAHTHQCMVVPPIEQYALLNSGDNVRGRYFMAGPMDVDGDTWFPPDARWFANTGTLRRGGSFDFEDYSEIAGYAPPAIACVRTTISQDRVLNVEKIML